MAEGAHWHRVGDKLAEGGRIHTNLEGRPVCARAGACTGLSGSCKKRSGIPSGILTRMCETQISVLRHQGKLFCIDSMCYHGLTRHVPSRLEKKNECMILCPCSIFPCSRHSMRGPMPESMPRAKFVCCVCTRMHARGHAACCVHLSILRAQ